MSAHGFEDGQPVPVVAFTYPDDGEPDGADAGDDRAVAALAFLGAYLLDGAGPRESLWRLAAVGYSLRHPAYRTQRAVAARAGVAVSTANKKLRQRPTFLLELSRRRERVRR